MIRLNLGCGNDVKEGYLNVDFRKIKGTTQADLSQFPWVWDDGSVDEILMFDFLEHFPYRDTDKILRESWRVLREGCPAIIQVPSFEECSAAMNFDTGMLCNSCGFTFDEAWFMGNDWKKCGQCGQGIYDIAAAARNRLFGGQDYEGNWHFNTFTKNTLQWKLSDNGFKVVEFLEEEHQRVNWNMKALAVKISNLWGENE